MCACAHFVCLPPFLPANFKEQAEAKVFNIMCATQEIADAKAKELLLDESPKPSSSNALEDLDSSFL